MIHGVYPRNTLFWAREFFTKEVCDNAVADRERTQ